MKAFEVVSSAGEDSENDFGLSKSDKWVVCPDKTGLNILGSVSRMRGMFFVLFLINYRFGLSL